MAPPPVTLPNSSAAQASFLAAAGPTTLVNFEHVAVGFSSPVVPRSTVSIALNAPDFGNGFSGISNTTLGNLDGFNVARPAAHSGLARPKVRRLSTSHLP